MEPETDENFVQTLALLRVALSTVKRAQSTACSPAFPQLLELQTAARDVVDECVRQERDAVEQSKAALRKYEADLSSLEKERETLAAEADRQRQEIEALGEQIDHLKKQLRADRENNCKLMQTTSKQISILEWQLEQERRLIKEEIAHLKNQLAELKKQLAEEKEKLLCVVCVDKPRDTLIMPCLHFHYCFTCLMQHKKDNGDTCPTCRGFIQGLCMSPFFT